MGLVETNNTTSMNFFHAEKQKQMKKGRKTVKISAHYSLFLIPVSFYNSRYKIINKIILTMSLFLIKNDSINIPADHLYHLYDRLVFYYRV